MNGCEAPNDPGVGPIVRFPAALFLSSRRHLQDMCSSFALQSTVTADQPVPAAQTTPAHHRPYLTPLSTHTHLQICQPCVFVGRPPVTLERRVQSLAITLAACIVRTPRDPARNECPLRAVNIIQPQKRVVFGLGPCCLFHGRTEGMQPALAKGARCYMRAVGAEGWSHTLRHALLVRSGTNFAITFQSISP